MFYSQFILAKKGPLGTIWIAAHLERKLRKNQVADTDIGESVDSILFPDVPIALRLSSHLLLGVVRIYSRKVNYLFHDCSEALLRIKQAFRSTAVDLPPEESTAPYHSITLPEKFDLDDFELPDSAFLNSNFVDHHVSSREQITLQDTVEATGYSTSQFGLDERFGDGDASQIHLDLDEGMVLESGSAANEVAILFVSEDVEHNISGQPETPFPDMNIDGCQNDCEEQNAGTAEVPEHLGSPLQNVHDLSDGDRPSHGYGVQVLPDSFENAQAPSTPGLMQEAVPASVQENPALSPSGKASPSNDTEAVAPIASHSYHMESGCHDPNWNSVLLAARDPSEHSFIPHDESVLTCGDSVQKDSDLIRETTESHTHGSWDRAGNLDACHDDATLTLNSDSSMKPCNSKVSQADSTVLQDGTSELLHKEPVSSTPEFPDGKEQSAVSVELQGTDMDINWKSGYLNSPPNADVNKNDDLVNSLSKDVRLEINCSASNECLETERMLFATGGHQDVANDFGRFTTSEKGVTDSEGSVDRVKTSRGRKRRLIGTTPILLNDDSSKLLKASQLRRNTDCLPDDDDVLASILVGRSSGLKMKPTPSFPTVSSSKRARLSLKVGVPKRKVLLDDTMVLHADVIRQQLVNTEDIRRTRRKAPCTRPEIWMIKKCSLEEEIFAEPALTGMSMELDVLQCQTYDLSETPDLHDNKSIFHVALEAQIPRDSEFFEGVRPAWVDGTKNTDCESQEVGNLLEASQAMPSSCVDSGKENLQEASDVISARAQIPFSSSPKFGNECHLSSNPMTVMPSGEEKRENEMHNGPALSEDQPPKEPAQSCMGFDKMNDKLEKVLEDNICGLNKEGCVAEDPSLSSQRDSDLDGGKAIVTGDVSISMLDNCSTEVRRTFSNDPSVSVADTYTAVQDVDILTDEPLDVCNSTCIHSLEEVNEQDVHFTVDGERKDDSGNSMSKVMLVKEHQAAVPNSEPTCGLDDYPSAIGENSSFHDVTGTGNSIIDSFAPRDSNVQDFCSGVGGNDTDFLNVDDEEGFDDGVENEITNTEEAQSIETSGWSTRTRGVARYLKSLFDDEAGKSVAVDRLLAGKSRKEASRLFFEALVLKTKDYIQVEQDSSFENITVRPRARLLKIEF